MTVNAGAVTNALKVFNKYQLYEITLVGVEVIPEETQRFFHHYLNSFPVPFDANIIQYHEMFLIPVQNARKRMLRKHPFQCDTTTNRP
jgi:hypothetical protein